MLKLTSHWKSDECYQSAPAQIASQVMMAEVDLKVLRRGGRGQFTALVVKNFPFDRCVLLSFKLFWYILYTLPPFPPRLPSFTYIPLST